MNVATGDRRKFSCHLAIALLAAVCLLTPAIAETTIHKWVDEKGVTHYSQDPPPRRKSEAITIQSAPTSPGAKAAPKAARNLQQEEAEFQRRQRAREAAELREREKARATAQKQAQSASQCASARARIERLQNERRGQLERDRQRVISTPATDQAFDPHGTELNKLGQWVDANCPPE